MSLKWKFLLRDWGLVVGLVLIAVASLWGLDGIRQEVRPSLGAYEDIGTIQAANREVALAINAIEASGQTPPNVKAAQAQIAAALDNVKRFIAREKVNYDMSHGYLAQRALGAADKALVATPPDTQAATASLNQISVEAGYLVGICHNFIEARVKAAGHRLWYTMLTISIIFAVMIVGATISSTVQYRSVMIPLQRLRDGVRRVAAAQFTGKVDERGDKEFAEVAAEFNRMAAELDGFYRRLEEKVNAKSRELVRSERLASVGFLAAGVAHEINNPLNIISGYSELSLKRLAAAVDQSAIRDTLQVLRIIRDESFRCKEITAKLLSLAKGGSDSREPVALDTVAREVAELAGGLKDYRDRRIELKFDGPLNVVANATEMKQVLLNLTVNALQAVKPGEGKVLIEGHRHDGWVELSVCDNGYGIPADSLKHVFEPFYSRRPGTRAPGTGLGLSITHAIVENHGGRIRAESPGSGHGSRFTVELPAVAGESK